MLTVQVAVRTGATLEAEPGAGTKLDFCAIGCGAGGACRPECGTWRFAIAACDDDMLKIAERKK